MTRAVRSAVDIDWVPAVFGRWHCTRRFSPRGHTPSPPMLRQLATRGVAMQQVVRSASGTPMAWVQLVDVDPDHGYGSLALLADPQRVLPVRAAVAAFIDAVLRDVHLRKLCVLACADEIEVPDFFGPRAVAAGRLTAHERRADDTYVDMVLYEIWP